MGKRVLIVGGVAGGASCAARLRRLDESAEIILFDRGHHVSFANCGLPYFVGDVIAEERNLVVSSPEIFRQRFNIDVRTRHEVTAIDRAAQTIRVRALEQSGSPEKDESYDALVLSPGAAPIRPPINGIDLPGIFAVRTIPDSVRIRSWIEQRRPARAVVVGGGFIGLEMAENLARRGLQVAVLEKLTQVMPPFDLEMAYPVQQHLTKHGWCSAGDGLQSSSPMPPARWSCAPSGAGLPATSYLSIGGVWKPLARDAGLSPGCAGESRSIASYASDPHIWAVGDASR
jgi:NADPH-dependent 2,4-dienoyl-CoA reductase/sulfur reductase-like enzyme